MLKPWQGALTVPWLKQVTLPIAWLQEAYIKVLWIQQGFLTYILTVSMTKNYTVDNFTGHNRQNVDIYKDSIWLNLLDENM